MSVLKIALLGPPEVEHGDHQYHLVPWAWFLSWWFSPNASYGGVCCLRSNNWLNHRNQFYRDVYTALLWEVNGRVIEKEHTMTTDKSTGQTSLSKFKDCLRVPPILHPHKTEDQRYNLRIHMRPAQVQLHSELPPTEVFRLVRLGEGLDAVECTFETDLHRPQPEGVPKALRYLGTRSVG